MSDAATPREWRFYVEDMIAFCDKALNYTKGLDRSTFVADPMRYDATLRNLELIGEAATHVPDDVRNAAADVPWRMIVALKPKVRCVMQLKSLGAGNPDGGLFTADQFDHKTHAPKNVAAPARGVIERCSAGR